MNVYLYKDGKYSRILNRTAPTVFENAAESFNQSDVDYWKSKAESYYKAFVLPKVENKKSEEPTTSESSESDDNIPF